MITVALGVSANKGNTYVIRHQTFYIQKKSGPHVAKGLHDGIRPQHLQVTSLPGKQVTVVGRKKIDKREFKKSRMTKKA